MPEELSRLPLTSFVLQVWAEADGGPLTEWRGRIHHPASGAARYFRDWLTLSSFIETTMIAEAGRAGSPFHATADELERS